MAKRSSGRSSAYYVSSIRMTTFPSPSLPHPLQMAPPTQLPFKRMSPAAAESSSEESLASSSVSLNLSLLIILAIIALVFVTSASIHLLLRLLSSRRRASSFAAAPPLQEPALRQSRSDLSSSPAAAARDSGLSDKDRAAMVGSLPLFSLASLPKSSLDCAVCLYSFRPHDELRLLPACRHAFHSQCVDPWLRSTPSCPLCRTSITVCAPLQLPPPPPPLGMVAPDGDSPSPGSFRVEIGSVSRRISQPEAEPPAANPQSRLRTFSLGSSFEYVVDEEVEAVVSRIRRLTRKEEKRDAMVEHSATEAAPAAPGTEVVEAVGGGGKGWLREHVDRLASSASSSFSSLRFSGRWSHRYDCGRHSWDLEGSARREAEEGGYYGYYRWLIGV